MSGMSVKHQRMEDEDRSGGRAFTFVLIAAGVLAAAWMFLESSGGPPVAPVGPGDGEPCGECTCAPPPLAPPAPESTEAGTAGSEQPQEGLPIAP